MARNKEKAQTFKLCQEETLCIIQMRNFALVDKICNEAWHHNICKAGDGNHGQITNAASVIIMINQS
jgi:hypothetical protein